MRTQGGVPARGKALLTAPMRPTNPPPTTPCTPPHSTTSERYAGLWEVPVWVAQTDQYPTIAYAMDPFADTESDTADSVYKLLKYNFDLAYNGNRAPVPM